MINIALSLQSKLESVNENILKTVCRLNKNFSKLESELKISKQIKYLLQQRVIDLEKQCWANIQYSGRECKEMEGLVAELDHSNLEAKLVQNFSNILCYIYSEYIEACHRISKKIRTLLLKFF